MKKTLLSGSIILMVVLTSAAQITITRNDLGNLVGTDGVRGNDNTNLSALSVGSPGANQFWNLSAMSNDYQDTMQILSPAGTPCPDDFPTATFAFRTTGRPEYTYGYDDNTVIELQGACGVLFPPDTTTVFYTPPQRFLIFPLSYNTSWTDLTRRVMQFPDTSAGPPDSIRIVSAAYYSDTVDGWGNVVTPVSAYPSLRLKISKNTVDSIFAYISGFGWLLSQNPTITNEVEYQWWTNNNFMVAALGADSTGSNVTYAQYLINSIVGAEGRAAETSLPLLYPDPASESFTIANLSSEAKMLTITDVLGKQVFETTINNNSVTISAIGFDTGIFYYRVLDNKGLTIQKGKFLAR